MKITIPVIIDSIKEFPDFDFSRCSYFSIECDDLVSPLSAPDFDTIPFYQPNVADMSRIIIKPLDDSDIFDTVDKIDDLFDAIENGGTFYIDTNDIWLPNTFFRGGHLKTVEDVFRIPADVFDAALWVRENNLNKDRLLQACTVQSTGARFEPQETVAFQKWGEKHINDAKSRYQADPSKHLAKK